MLHKIKKIYKTKEIDQVLLDLYQNSNTDSMNEFIEDCTKIRDLKKSIKRLINDYNSDFRIIKNNYILLRNIFGIQGIVYISITYFSEDEILFEYFSSLPYFFDEVQICNRMSKKFLKWLKKEQDFINNNK